MSYGRSLYGSGPAGTKKWQSSVFYRSGKPRVSYRKGPRVKLRGRTRTVGYYGRYNKGLGGELKFHDVNLNVDPLAVAGSVTASLNLIAQGNGESQRLGRKCFVKSIHIRGRWQVDTAGASDQDTTIRMIIFIDKQCNGATAAVTDILDSAGYTSFRSLVNSGRFKICMDRNYTLHKDTEHTSADAVVTFQKTRDFQWHKKLNVPLLFDGATGAITEICCQNIGVLFICDNVGSAPKFNGNVRLRFQGWIKLSSCSTRCPCVLPPIGRPVRVPLE